MIHITHTTAAELARQRQLLAWRAFGYVLPPWVGVLLWAFCTPLLQPCGNADCNFTGVIFEPIAVSIQESPSRLVPVQISSQVTEPGVDARLLRPDLGSISLPEIPWSSQLLEPDDITLETDTDALLAAKPQVQQPAPPRQTSAAAKAPASDTYIPPAYDRCPQPPYPPQLRQRRVQGSVVLTISVAADGSPTAGETSLSSGSAVLDRHALNWVLRHWRFTPARRNNTACPAIIRTKLHFTL